MDGEISLTGPVPRRRSLSMRIVHDIEWRGFTEYPVFDRLMFWNDKMEPGPFTAAPANRLQVEEVGVPIFDY